MKYSETFFSAQGEGKYVGVPSLWLRFFSCNLQCNGFGQEDPTNPETYELPYETIDITDITRVEDLPVFDKGCDSSYTWSKKYKHLMKDKTATEAVEELTALLPYKTFEHPVTGQSSHMVFTGGEPMIKANQRHIVDIVKEFGRRGNLPSSFTIETNGTKMLEPELRDLIKDLSKLGIEWFWSVSPKLWSVAGEKADKAIKPEAVASYFTASNKGQLKYVVNNSEAAWNEVSTNTKLYRNMGVDWDVWVMGVGGTLEGLKVTEADIADEAIQRGYNYTSRVHCHIYGNAIGK